MKAPKQERPMRNFGWHFTGKTLRDGSKLPRVGRWEHYQGNLVMCQTGLHVGLTPWDALKYAPGENLRYVEYANVGERHNDKIVCAKRRTIAQMDATELLRYFARMQALSVIHLWDAPDIVLDYLMTGDNRLRLKARDAAQAAASAVASAVARAAAVAAASAAASACARDAASAAARAVARAVAWNAARAAASARVRAAVSVVAWGAAWAAAWAAAQAAAQAAARTKFNALVFECFSD